MTPCPCFHGSFDPFPKGDPLFSAANVPAAPPICGGSNQLSEGFPISRSGTKPSRETRTSNVSLSMPNMLLTSKNCFLREIKPRDANMGPFSFWFSWCSISCVCSSLAEGHWEPHRPRQNHYPRLSLAMDPQWTACGLRIRDHYPRPPARIRFLTAVHSLPNLTWHLKVMFFKIGISSCRGPFSASVRSPAYAKAWKAWKISRSFLLFRGHFRSLEVVVKAHRSALVKAWGHSIKTCRACCPLPPFLANSTNYKNESNWNKQEANSKKQMTEKKQQEICFNLWKTYHQDLIVHSAQALGQTQT